MRRFLPLVCIALLVLIFYLVGGFSYLDLEKIRLLDRHLIQFSMQSPLMAIFLFLMVYVIYAISSIPGLIILDLVAGYLFGKTASFCLVLLGATLGAVGVFLATRYAFGESASSNKTKWMQRIKEGFDRHQVSYLLFMRIVPFVPFNIANITLGLLDIKLYRYIWTTLLGLIPATFIYTQAGTGLGRALQKTGPIEISHFVNAELIFSLIGLSVLALLPIVIKRKK
jgi:uncharacterized membrane protein YdjX (TVP38/TMEM64 family)